MNDRTASGEATDDEPAENTPSCKILRTRLRAAAAGTMRGRA